MQGQPAYIGEAEITQPKDVLTTNELEFRGSSVERFDLAWQEDLQGRHGNVEN
jgi:hypothetical protein